MLRGLLLFAWITASLLIFPVLLAPFLLPVEAILSAVPNCGSLGIGGSLLCALAKGFILVSRGEFDEAVRANAAAIPVYAALVWNQCVAIWFVWTELALMRQPAPGARKCS